MQMITSYATSSRYRMVHSSEIEPLSGSGCARGRRLWAGPFGLAAISSGRAEGRSGLRVRWCLPPARGVFQALGFERRWPFVNIIS